MATGNNSFGVQAPPPANAAVQPPQPVNTSNAPPNPIASIPGFGGTAGSTKAAQDEAQARWNTLSDDEKAQAWGNYMAAGGSGPPNGDFRQPPPVQTPAELDTIVSQVAPFTASDPTFSADASAQQALFQQNENPGTLLPGISADGGGTAAGASYQASQSDIDRAIKNNSKAAPYMQAVVFYAGQNNIPWQVLYAAIDAGSGFDPNFSSGAKSGIGSLDPSDPASQDPMKSLQSAAQQLADYHSRYNDWGLALIALQQGSATADYLRSHGTSANGTQSDSLAYLTKAYKDLDALGYNHDGADFSTAAKAVGANTPTVKMLDQATTQDQIKKAFEQTLFRDPTPDEMSNFYGMMQNSYVQAQLADAQNANPWGDTSSTAPDAGTAGGTAQAAGNFLTTAGSVVGHPYLWGGESTGPQGAFDCSGLVQWAMKTATGYDPGRDTTAQFNNRDGQNIPDISQALPGDIIFFGAGQGPDGGPEHEAIYLGNGQIEDANHPGGSVGIRSLQGYGAIAGIKRFPAVAGSTTPASMAAGGYKTSTQAPSPADTLTQGIQNTALYKQLYQFKPKSMTDQQWQQQFQNAGSLKDSSGYFSAKEPPSDLAMTTGMAIGDPNATAQIAAEQAFSSGHVADLLPGESTVAESLRKVI